MELGNIRIKIIHPTRGFERCLRENCCKELDGCTISQQREMNLGINADTLSGINHRN